MRVRSIDQCLAACLANPQCQALTLNTDPEITRGPNCFLKSDRGRGEYYDQAISIIRLLPGEDETLIVGSERVFPNEARPRE